MQCLYKQPSLKSLGISNFETFVVEQQEKILAHQEVQNASDLLGSQAE